MRFSIRRKRTKHGLEPEMVEVPAGQFVIGSTEADIRHLKSRNTEWRRMEMPQHTLNLPPFHIARYPVTVGQFAAFIEAGGYHERRYWTRAGWSWRRRNRITAPEFWGESPWTDADDLPVVGVSWYSAVAYCNWLSELTGKPYRLPTEAEWEKAARGTDARIYPWGNKWDAKACNVNPRGEPERWARSKRRRKAKTTPVGKYSPRGDSPYGCADMAGNVWEWCADAPEDYPLNLHQPLIIDGSGPRIVRGGSWYHGPEDARCAARYVYYPGGRDNVVGFRVALG